MEQSELSARLAGDRVFSDRRFAADIVLDEELPPEVMTDPDAWAG